MRQCMVLAILVVIVTKEKARLIPQLNHENYFENIRDLSYVFKAIKR